MTVDGRLLVHTLLSPVRPAVSLVLRQVVFLPEMKVMIVYASETSKIAAATSSSAARSTSLDITENWLGISLGLVFGIIGGAAVILG
jgi:hypothetical protein